MRVALAVFLLSGAASAQVVLEPVGLPDGGVGYLCPPTSASGGGCLLPIDHQVGGIKRFQDSATFSPGPYGYAAYLLGDTYVGGSLQAPTNQPLRLFGARHPNDPTAGVIFQDTFARDAGDLFATNDSAGGQKFAVNVHGVVKLSGAPPQPGALSGYAQIQDNSGVAGHVVMRPMDGQGLTLAGAFGAPGTHATRADGGTISFAGLHGEVAITSLYPRTGGLMTDWRNVRSGNGALTDMVAFVDYNGGFGQRHGLTKAQFGTCPAVLVPAYWGEQCIQFYDGQLTSVRMWATDEEYWYTCKSSGWVRDP